MTPAQLRAWRRRLGLTQQQAAEALGYSWRHYVRWEYGEAEMPPRVVKMIKLLKAQEKRKR